MGNLIFGTTTVQGRTFDDIKIQTSKAGVPRPIVFGTARPIVGNIIATTAPRIVKKKEEQSGGKGGPTVEVENEEVFRTYAIRICEGPVTGITRVWRNNELVYERDSENATQIENNEAFLEKAEFFLGSFSQMPSSLMQAAFGINNVHAYRGTCYMVVDDENLTATGGAIPQYAFEVERCEGFVLTSSPYVIEQVEALSLVPRVLSVSVRDIIKNYSIIPESIQIEPSITEVTLRELTHDYIIQSESIDISPRVTSISLEIKEVNYSSPEEYLDLAPSITAISITDVVINYGMVEESMDLRPIISHITLQV